MKNLWKSPYFSLSNALLILSILYKKGRLKDAKKSARIRINSTTPVPVPIHSLFNQAYAESYSNKLCV